MWCHPRQTRVQLTLGKSAGWGHIISKNEPHCPILYLPSKQFFVYEQQLIYTIVGILSCIDGTSDKQIGSSFLDLEVVLCFTVKFVKRPLLRDNVTRSRLSHAMHWNASLEAQWMHRHAISSPLWSACAFSSLNESWLLQLHKRHFLFSLYTLCREEVVRWRLMWVFRLTGEKSLREHSEFKCTPLYFIFMNRSVQCDHLLPRGELASPHV